MSSPLLQFFPRYSNYCKQQNKAIAIVRKLKKTSKFSHFYADCRKNPACRGMEMTVLLLLPLLFFLELPHHARLAYSSLPTPPAGAAEAHAGGPPGLHVYSRFRPFDGIRS